MIGDDHSGPYVTCVRMPPAARRHVHARAHGSRARGRRRSCRSRATCWSTSPGRAPPTPTRSSTRRTADRRRRQLVLKVATPAAARRHDQPLRRHQLRRVHRRRARDRLRLRRRRPPLPQQRRPVLPADQPPARLPAAVRRTGALLRALPPRRLRLRARRAPAGLHPPGQGAARAVRSGRSSSTQIAKAFGEAIRTDITGDRGPSTSCSRSSRSRSRARSARSRSSTPTPTTLRLGGEDYVTSTPQLIARASATSSYENPTAAQPPPQPAASRPRAQRRTTTVDPAAAPGSAASADLYPLRPRRRSTRRLRCSPQRAVPGLPADACRRLAATPNDFHPYTVHRRAGPHARGLPDRLVRHQAGRVLRHRGHELDRPAAVRQPRARPTRIDGRTYMFIDDGAHFHDIGWRVGRRALLGQQHAARVLSQRADAGARGVSEADRLNGPLIRRASTSIAS